MKSKRRNWLLGIIMIFFYFQMNAQWIPSQGLDGANVSDLVVLDTTLFICANGNGIYSKDLDGGTWAQIAPVGGHSIVKCQNALFTWGFYNCYRSIDHGVTWQEMTSLWNSGAITSLCVIDSSLFFISQFFNGEVYRTDDAGNTIYPVTNNLPPLGSPTVTSGDSGLLFCYQNYPDHHLFRSSNKGITWDSITLSGLPSGSCDILTIGSLGSTLWLSATTGIYRMNSLQGPWTFIEDSIWLMRIKVINGVLFATTQTQGPYRLDPITNQWIQETTGLESTVTNGFCVDDNLIYLATEAGPYKCVTPYTWLPFYQGLNLATVSAVTAHNNEVWVVTPRGSFISADQGTTFIKQPLTGMPNPSKLILTDSLYYALANGSFYWSLDHGYTWSRQHTGLPEPPQVPFLYCNSLVLDAGYLFLATNTGLYRSSCGTIVWSAVPSIGFGNARSLFLYGADSILLAVKEAYTAATQFFSFRSANQGQTFDSISSLPLPGYPPVFANEDSHFYALVFNRLSKSQDQGLNWSEIPVGNSAIYGHFLSVAGPAVMVGGSILNVTLTDLYLSVTYNDGITWTDILDNLPVPGWPIFTCLETNQQRTFVSPNTNGLWYRDGLLTAIPEKHASVANGIIISPNPACDLISMSFILPEHSEGLIRIFSMNGALVFNGNTIKFTKGENSVIIDLKEFETGLYAVLVSTAQKSYQSLLQIIK